MLRLKHIMPNDLATTTATTWPLWAKRLVSLLLAVHLAAMLAVALAGVPASQLERDFAGWFGPYPSLVALDSVHRYYAPAPPPTPILTLEITLDDGSTQLKRIPDRGARPRLRYQRQLALAYHLYAEFQRASRDPRGPRASAWGASYARHVLLENPRGRRVVLRAQEHLIPFLMGERPHEGDESAHGLLDPDDPRYFTVPEVVGEYSREELLSSDSGP